MKLHQFRALIREMVEAEMASENHQKPKFVDKLGKFYVVCHVDSVSEDPMYTMTMTELINKIQDGSLDMDKVAGIYKDSKAARAMKVKIANEVKKHREDLDEEMDSIRELRRQEKEKKDSIRSKVEQMKNRR